MGWLVEKDIVQALLRAHLHQRQYMDQVQRVLKILAAEGGFQADHLELLWALTEKARTHPRARNQTLLQLTFGAQLRAFDTLEFLRSFSPEPKFQQPSMAPRGILQQLLSACFRKVQLK